MILILRHSVKEKAGACLGGSVVKNPLASAGDTGLIPCAGRCHMLGSN